MNVCEIFYSIQGESSFAGLPCIFIRLSGCNLRCTYCDTTYSYEPGKDFTIDQILQEISRFNCKLVMLTGGEPLLQELSIDLLESLCALDYEVLLETNGSLSVRTVPSAVHLIVDVKLPGSGHSDSFLPDNLLWLKADKDELKFVISDRNDFDFAIAFISAQNLQKYRLLFSPVTEKIKPAVLAEWIKETALPIRLNLQLHKLIWDKNIRAV